MAKKGARSRLAANQARIRKLTGLLLVAVALFTALRLVRRSPTARWPHYASLVAATGLGGACIAALRLHASPTFDAAGGLEDGGADLALPGGFLSTLHDGVYVASAALLGGALIHDGCLALLGAYPAYGVAKAWSGVVAPLLASLGGPAAGGPGAAAEEAKAKAAAEKRARKAAKRGGGGPVRR